MFNGSVAVTPTIPANEVWILNSAISNNNNVSLGTTGIASIVGFGQLTAGSRATLAPAFTSAVPLIITPAGTSAIYLSGHKFTTSTAPYIPQRPSASVVNGGRLLLQPPVNKLWRFLYLANNSGASQVNFVADISLNGGTTWLNSGGGLHLGAMLGSSASANGRMDMWSWRDKPLSIRNNSGSTVTLTAYVLEFDEADFLSSRVFASQALGAGNFDIRPPVGEDWIIDGIYTDSPSSLSVYTMANGVQGANSMFMSAYGPYRIDNTNYIRLNLPSAATVAYVGRKLVA
jgi:hypothetical protein